MGEVMERLGFGVVEIADLDFRLHKSVRARLKKRHIKERAESVASHGIIYRPLVRVPDGLLVDGADRVAVCLARGEHTVDVEFVSCTDEQAHHIRRHANAHRRHDPDEQAALLLEDLNAVQVAIMSEAPWIRRSLARGAARRLIAQKTGANATTLQKKDYQARKRLLALGEPEPEVQPPVRELGMELDVEWMKQVHESHALLKKAATHLTSALKQLSQLNNSELPYPRPKLQRLMSDLSDLSSAVRKAVPYSLCPYCKGLESVQENCSGCAGQGFILKDQSEGIPHRLWDEHYPVVAVDGIYKPVEHLG